jgi:hypothetical protein
MFLVLPEIGGVSGQRAQENISTYEGDGRRYKTENVLICIVRVVRLDGRDMWYVSGRQIHVTV